MPANLVKTKHDEKLWEEAKKQYEKHVKKSGEVENKWAYITKIFQSMKTGGHKTKGTAKIMTINLRATLANAVIHEFLIQADAIVLALDEPAAVPPQKRAPAVPNTQELDHNANKNFVGLTNLLQEVEGKLKHSFTMMLGYSTSFQKELKKTLQLFDKKKTKLTVGDMRAMVQLVDAVEKVMKAVDSVADRFEMLHDATQKLGQSTQPYDSKVSQKARESMGLPPITDVGEDLKHMETKTKMKDFFQEIKNKFGSKPQAASVLLARALITTATVLADEQ